MKLNNEIINKIFNTDPKKRIKIKSKTEKIELSKYEELIPMYDIYSEKVYAISKENIYYRLINCHYRFITHEVKKWIENKYNKYKDDNNKFNLDIIDNYDIDTLIETSYKILYKYSHQLGLSISICKRNSFNKYSKHLNPYYSKDELIKLGLNMKIISEKDKIDLNDPKIHYKICVKISNNDISAEEIINHNNFIIDSQLISLISNYSFMGSYYMNRYLRGFDKNPNSLTIELINRLANKMLKSPKLENDYYLYRFIWDDNFIKNLKIGDKFIDKGFVSSTRDPFYSPGLKSNFGLILLKIKIPKNKNYGLLIENFSLFPKEEEYLLAPFSEFKLISKDSKFKYYHTNNQFENLVESKYEFELVNNKFEESSNTKNYDTYKILDEKVLFENSKINIIRSFISEYKVSDSQLNIKVNDINYIINYNWFDGTDSYEKLYYNKINNGMFFVIYDEYLYPYLSIEFGEEMVVNYLNKMYYYDNKKRLENTDIDLISRLAHKFTYNSFKLFLEYDNFSTVSKLDIGKNKSYLYTSLYCSSLYQYIKNNVKFYSNLDKFSNYSNFEFGYWKLNKLLNTMLPDDMFKRFSKIYNKNIKLGEFIVDIIENHFYYYEKLGDIFKQFKLDNLFEKLYLNFDVIAYYQNKNIPVSNNNIPYDSNRLENDENFKLVYNQPIRRIN
jgi:hypothetical protein